MKLLFLTAPYSGTEYMAELLAKASGHDFIADPMNLEWNGASTFHTTMNLETGEIYSEQATTPRPYVFPNDIPANTIVTHNVKWHKLPGNLTEDQFLGDFIGKFDRVIVVRNRRKELNWQRWAASTAQPHEDNILWKQWLAKNCNGFIYEDQWFDQTKVDKINECDSFLESYYNMNDSFVQSFVDDYFHDSPEGEKTTIEKVDFEMKRFGLDIGDVQFTEENGWENYDLFHLCNNWIHHRY
jgi:hypothetical protein